MGRLVWAFEPLDETNGDTGFVEIDDEAVADKLIASGKVQDGWDPDGGELKYINSDAVNAYATRQLKAGTSPRPRDDPPPKPKPDPDPPEAEGKPKAKTGKAK